MDKTELFEKKPVPKAIVTLAVPTILSSMTMLIYNLADTYFVGILNQPVQNAAVTLAAPVLLSFNAVNNLFGVGSSSLMSQALGRKDEDAARQSSVIGIYFSLFCVALFSIGYILFRYPLLALIGADTETMMETGEYLKWTVMLGAVPAILNVIFAYQVRAEGASLHASIGTMSGCILNILLDPIFILPWGLGLGAEGAGLATFISNCVSCIYFFILLFIKRKHTYVCIDPRKFSFGRNIVLGMFGIGVPASLQNLLNVTSMTILNRFTSSYGTNVVAAMGIANRINMIPNYIVLGLAQGVMPLISYNYSSGNHKRLRETVLFAMKASVIVVSVLGAGIFLGSEFMTGLFIRNGQIIEYGSRLLRGFVVSLPFFCIDFITVVTLQACSMNRQAFCFPILRKIVFEVPALAVLNRLFQFYGLPYAQLISELIMSIVAVIVIRQILLKSHRDETNNYE